MSRCYQRTSAQRPAALVLVIASVIALGCQSAAAATSRTRHPAAPVRAAALSSELQHATGYSASQLTTRAACGDAATAKIRCYARVLTVRGTGRPASLLHLPHVSSASARPAVASSAPASFTAGFLQWAYDTTWLSANRGAGDTVAIVDAYGDPSAYSDMQQFRTANGLPQIPTCGGSTTTSCFELVNQSGHTSPLPGNGNDETGSWNIEESLDIDAVSSLCPLCKILVVEANSDDSDNLPDLEQSVSTAASLGANQISLSWGGDTTPDAAVYESPYSSITSAAILAASGDSSYPGPKVGYPAALPTVTAVGGTALAADASVARGFDESTWAKSTCSDGSTCGTESGCDTSQSVPSYQSGLTTDCTGRAYNDISADASPDTGLNIYDSQPGTEGCGTASNMCIVGGTSLATPLSAAFEAIAGITSTTPAWSYGDRSLLNDIVTGSDGSCPSGKTVICNAGLGWDGPTGNGSINGDVVAGAPGIGAQPDATSIGATSAAVSGEVIPNDSSASAGTAYQWQYGTTTSYGSTTASTPLPSGTSFEGANATLSLPDACTYHYRLVASNALGTVYGYDHTVTPTTGTTPPVNASPPTITGTAAIGQQVSAQPGTWSGGYGCVTTYQWQESTTPGGTYTPISGATSAAYTPSATDVGQYLEVAVTETNPAGSATATSGPTAQVPPPPVPTAAPSAPSPPSLTSNGVQAAVNSTTVVRFYRCGHSCTLISSHGATTYTPRKVDYGRYIKVVTTVTRSGGGAPTTTNTSTRWVGPITSATAGDVRLGSGARVAATTIIRSSTRRSLAQVRVAGRRAGRLTLVVGRTTTAATQVWAYVVAGGAVVSGTRTHSLGRRVTLSFALKRGQTVRLVAVRT